MIDPELTPEQVQKITSRIAEINKHFETCCAFQMDRCHMAAEYDKLHDLLSTFGVEIKD